VEPIPFTVLPALVVYDVLLGLFFVGETVIRYRSGRNSRGSSARPERVSFALLIVAFLVAVVGSLLLAGRVPDAAIPGGRVPLYVVGVVLMAAGLALRWTAVVVLGRSFTVEVRVQDEQQVVDRGPFGVVRHPSYTGLLLVFLGMGLALTNWLALIVAFVPPLVGIVYRIRVEEAMLADGLGEPYRAYGRRVRFRLVPFVW
jgi:protein-S-isoprenylcysteine O-methyltransferase Ste14